MIDNQTAIHLVVDCLRSSCAFILDCEEQDSYRDGKQRPKIDIPLHLLQLREERQFSCVLERVIVDQRNGCNQDQSSILVYCQVKSQIINSNSNFSAEPIHMF